MFRPGESGNPVGRPKGSKNKITLLKQSLELQLREQAAPNIGAVLAKAVELALKGDKVMIKLLLELHMSRSQHQDDQSDGKNHVTLVVQNLTQKGEVRPTVTVRPVNNVTDAEVITKS